MCEVDRPALFVGERLSEVTSLFGPVYRTRHGPWTFMEARGVVLVGR